MLNLKEFTFGDHIYDIHYDGKVEVTLEIGKPSKRERNYGKIIYTDQPPFYFNFKTYDVKIRVPFKCLK